MGKILSNRWCVVLLILPFLSIYYLQIGQMKTITQAMQCGVVLPLFFMVYRRVNTFNVLLVYLMGLMVLSGYINKNMTSSTVFFVITFSCFCFYISYAIRNFKELITGLYYLLGTLVIVNFLTMLVTPIDDNAHFLLGGKNSIGLTLLPAIVLVYVYSYLKYKKLKSLPLIIILISVLSIFLSGSGTGTIVSVLTLLFVFLPKRISPTLKTYLILYVVAFFSIVIYRVQEKWFAEFIVNVLHKDLTITGRTFIWDLVLSAMQDSWLIGLGRETTLIQDIFYPVSATHNGVLEVFMFTGVFGLAIFLLILLAINKKIKPYRDTPIAKVLAFSIFAYMIIGLTESVFFRIDFWLLLVISFNLDRIMKQINSKTINEESTQGNKSLISA